MTAIEWTHAPGFKGETWNPVVGCSVVSPGCANCYAMRFAGARLENNPKTPHYSGLTEPSNAGPVWTGKIAKAPEKSFMKPLRWRAPRMVFVNSMGDLFHEGVPDFLIDQVFAVMALCPQHKFLVLTKRAERMRDYLAQTVKDGAANLSPDLPGEGRDPSSFCCSRIAGAGGRMMEDGDNAYDGLLLTPWPLSHVWLGVSAEDQRRADERIPLLLETPAAIRFGSAEPLLGPIDFDCVPWPPNHARLVDDISDGRSALRFDPGPNIDWIIAGGESGPGARPSHPDWFRAIRDQCAAAGTPYFFKQWGEHLPVHLTPDEACVMFDATVGDGPPRRIAKGPAVTAKNGQAFARIGKRAAGHLLDGRTHREWPL